MPAIVQPENGMPKADLPTAEILIGAYLDAGKPIMLWGPAGVGKSDVCRQIAAARGWPLIDFRASLRDNVSLLGIPKADGSRAVWLPPGELPHADRDGPEGLLLLDEINAAHPSVQAALYGLVLDRRLGDYVMPPAWRIVAAGNRNADRGATHRMPAPLANRMGHVEIVPDAEAWARAALAGRFRDPAGNPIAPELVAFIRWRKELFWRLPEADATTFPTARAWVTCNAFLARPAAVRELLVGASVGMGAARQLETFLAAMASLPPLPVILASPETAPLPPDAGSQWAIATALGRAADWRNLPAVITYADRLPSAEYGAIAVSDATARTPGLREHPAYVDWVRSNPLAGV